MLNMCKQRDKLYKIWKKAPHKIENRILYNKYRNKTNRYINYIKNRYIMREICKNFKDSKKIWRIINELCGKTNNSIDDVILKHFKMSEKDLCNNFAQEFQTNVQKISIKCKTQILDHSKFAAGTEVAMRVRKASSSNILKIIKSLNDRKSPGYDKIRAIDIKKKLP